MLHSEVFDILMGRLGSRASSSIRARCVTELNLAIREIERGPTKPWFLETSASGSLVVDQDYLSLPANFLEEVEEGNFEITTAADGWIELPKVTRDRLRKETANADSAVPAGYAIWGNRFLLGPAPDLAYSYRFDYYARTSPVADNSAEVTNEWLLEFFNLVTYKALIVVVRDHIRDDRMAANFATAFKEAEDRFTRAVESRQAANETLLLTDEES